MANDGAETRRAGLTWPAVVTAAVVVGVVLYAFRAREEPAAAWELAGGVLQLCGFGVGALLLAGRVIVVGDARRPSRWLRDARLALRRRLRPLWLRFRELIGWPAENKRVSGSKTVPIDGVMAGTSEDSAVGRPVGGEVETWIRYLDGRLDTLEDRIEEQREERERDVEQLRRRLDGVRRAMRQEVGRLEGQIKEATVGSLRWEYVAIAWFVIGVVVSTWASALPAAPVVG